MINALSDPARAKTCNLLECGPASMNPEMIDMIMIMAMDFISILLLVSGDNWSYLKIFYQLSPFLLFTHIDAYNYTF